ncbi:MAG: cellulase [Pseudoxanthomonas spadix]|nr:MAG: cellulase [Pseudoxanthomonas spadix]
MRPIRSRRASLLLAATLALATPLAHAEQALRYAGVNLAGAEFQSSKKPGTLYKDYTYPTDADFAYFAAQGMNLVRLPFLWERLQPTLNGEFDRAQLDLLRKTVQTAGKHDITLLLDVHNYGAYNGQTIGSAAVPVAGFTDLWRRLASEPAFANNDKVLFGLMNEPHDIGANDWAAAAQAAIDAIRGTGAKNLILVPGTAWSGAHSWNNASAGRGVSNGDALAGLKDPANRLAFEAHQYLDRDSSGTKPECGDDPQIGARRLEGFTRWLEANNKVGFLGEFGASAECIPALDAMLAHIQAHPQQWLGWSYWAAGAWWSPTYPFNVQPNRDGSAKPQLPTLRDYAGRITGKKAN